MKFKLKSLTLSVILSSTLLAACTSLPTEKTAPTIPSVSEIMASTNPAPDTSADIQVTVKRVSLKALNNQEFSRSLKADPKAVLTEEGLSLSANEKVRVIDFLNDEGKVFLILDDRNLERFYGEQIKSAPSDDEASESLKTLRLIRAKVQSDADFKSKLLADPTKVLVEEGIQAEAAKNFEVLDFEPDTQFFLILPEDQQISRGVGGDAFSRIIDPKAFYLITLGQGMLRGDSELLSWVDGVGYIPETLFMGALFIEIKSAFVMIEGVCFFPRLFGAACSASEEQIKARIRKHFYDRYIQSCSDTKEKCDEDIANGKYIHKWK